MVTVIPRKDRLPQLLIPAKYYTLSAGDSLNDTLVTVPTTSSNVRLSCKRSLDA